MYHTKKTTLTEKQCSLISERYRELVKQDNVTLATVESLSCSQLDDFHGFVFGESGFGEVTMRKNLQKAGVTMAIIERVKTPFKNPLTREQYEDNVSALILDKPEIDRYYL